MNSNQIATSTFLQRLLGKNYKWWYCFIYQFRSYTYYFISTFFWLLSEISTLFIAIIIWSLSQRGDSNDILQYIIIGNAFFTLSNNDIAWHVNDKIYTGKLANNLMYPSSLFLQFLARSMANTLIQSLSILLVLVPIFVFYKSILNFNVEFVWLIVFWFLAYTLRFLTGLIAGSLAFWTTTSYGAIQFFYVFFPLLAGNLIPLNLLSDNSRILQFLPPAFTFYHPMQIYLGNYNTNQIILVFVGATFWCVLLYLLAKLLFKLGLKKNESVGL